MQNNVDALILYEININQSVYVCLPTNTNKLPSVTLLIFFSCPKLLDKQLIVKIKT